MKKSTWFRTGGNALGYVIVNSVSDLKTIISYSDQIKYYIVGVGSNLMVRDGGFNGLVIKLGKNFNKIKINKDTLSVGAGVLDVNLAKFALNNLIKDFEFFSGIPGTIGGAIKMNAGCFGREFKDILISVQAINKSRQVVTIPAKEINFKYRDSGLPNDLIFLSASFRGFSKKSDLVKSEMIKLKEKKEKAQPTKIKTSGSTFKNPLGQSDKKVWQLIKESVSLEKSFGDACISEKHCNFFVNKGNARFEYRKYKTRKKIFRRYEKKI
jgi:UDP-N-acetylmuramate dehydrogenase